MLGTRRVGKLLMLGMNSSTFTGGNNCNESLVLQIPFQEVFNPKNLYTQNTLSEGSWSTRQ